MNIVSNTIYYVLKKDCYIRDYNGYGYIVFAGLFKDLVVDKNGAIFLKALSRKPQTIEQITNTIFQHYTNENPKLNINQVRDDCICFYDYLVKKGFVVSGVSEEKLLFNNIGFTYAQIDKEESYDSGEESSQTVLDKSFNNRGFITTFQIELTSKCNERCVHCYIPHEYKNKDIEDKLYYSVINQLKEIGTLSVTLSGGEPMCHPHFKDYLKYAKDNDFYVHVLSNLTLLDDEILNIMKEGNKSAVQVSLYSMIPEHHDAITTVKGSFNKTKNAILKLIENDIPLQINCPVMKGNKNDVYNVLKFGKEHKVRVNVDYSIMAEYNHDVSNLANRLSPEECKDVIKQIIEFDEDYEKQIHKLNEENCTYNIDPNDSFCGVGINTCCMVSNGNVYPCPGWQGYVCGNLYERTLIDIWENSKEMNYLRNLKRKDMPKCLNCENREFCSPCLSRFANESKTGNMLEVAEHFCKVAKVNKEIVLDYLKKEKSSK